MRKLFKVGLQEHGAGDVLFSWEPSGNLLATVGTNGIVHIFGRNGKRIDEFRLNKDSKVDDLSWDCHGMYLAVIEREASYITIWNSNDKSKENVETTFQGFSMILWSKVGNTLAACTEKGNVFFYHPLKKLKIPVLGKHSAKISSGVWSATKILALSSEDLTLTLSNESGDTIAQVQTKVVICHMNFFQNSIESADIRDAKRNCLQSKELLSIQGSSYVAFSRDFNAKIENFVEVSTPDRSYGSILFHCLHKIDADDTLEMCVVYEIGRIESRSMENYQVKRYFKIKCNFIQTVKHSSILNMLAIGCDDGIHFFDLINFEMIEQDKIASNKSKGEIGHFHWSNDGSKFSVSTTSGIVFSYLSFISAVNACHGTAVAYVSGVREVTVEHFSASNHTKCIPRKCKINLEFDASILALSSNLLAYGYQNRIIVCRVSDSSMLSELTLPFNFERMEVSNSNIIILSDGNFHIGNIETNGMNTIVLRKFNPQCSLKDIVMLSVLPFSFSFAQRNGIIQHVSLINLEYLNECTIRCQRNIKYAVPNEDGTRVVLIFKDHSAELHLLVTGDKTSFPDFPKGSEKVLWDKKIPNLIQVLDNKKKLHFYSFTVGGLRGAVSVSKVSFCNTISKEQNQHSNQSLYLPNDHTPIMSISGIIYSQSQDGSLISFTSKPFVLIEESKLSNDKGNKLLDSFYWSLSLFMLQDAWELCLKLNEKQRYLSLAHTALEVLDLNIASHAYQRVGDAGMVQTLKKWKNIEDKYLLAGHVATLFGEHDMAQDLMLSSTHPVAAIHLRRNLHHYSRALSLAEKLDPTMVPEIHLLLAQQMELSGNYAEALSAYESVSIAKENSGPTADMLRDARFGYARCLIQQGEIKRGMLLAHKENEKKLYAQCGKILQELGHFMDAANMWTAAEKFLEAFSLFVKCDMFEKAEEIVTKINDVSLLNKYAAGCEKSAKFKKAADSYERAGNVERLVYLCLHHTDELERAANVARSTNNKAGAEMLSQYHIQQGNSALGVEFLIMAGKNEEAFELASSREEMESYIKFRLTSHGGIESSEYMRIAQHYESKREFLKAGQYFSECRQYQQALKILLKCGDDGYELAIDVVGRSQNELLLRLLINHLMGETDGIPKDPRYIYRLHLSLGHYKQAAKVANVIAKEEQDAGNYYEARSILCEVIRKLEANSLHVPHLIRSSFNLIHSYFLAKRMASRNEHERSARLLLRVSQSASKFPSHFIQLLTSTVVECKRAGLDAKAVEYAAVLMRPENRTQIDGKYRRNIETIVRKANGEEKDATEPHSTCPISGLPIPGTCLECPKTNEPLPMCIVSGRHMEKNDWTICPITNLPALYSEYIAALRSESNGLESSKITVPMSSELDLLKGSDPIYGETVHASQLRLGSEEEIKNYLHMYNTVDNE